MRRYALLLALSITLTPPSHAQDQQTDSLSQLPPRIKAFLDKKAPGWQFAKVKVSDVACYTKETQSHPSLTSGDFNGDGRPDYTLQIVHAGKLSVLEFLSRGDSFSMQVLYSGPVDKTFTSVLITEKKGEPTVTGLVAQIDDVYIGVCGDVGIRYVFRGGRVRAESSPD